MPEIPSSHLRYHSVVRAYTNGSSRNEVDALEADMREMLDTVPGSTFERLSDVTLPSALVVVAERTAKARNERAKRFSLQNKHGVTRSLPDERRSVEAQMAACLMLDLEFSHRLSFQEARKAGNIGHGISIFCPTPGRYGMIVGRKEPPSRRFVLIYQTDDHRYEFQGWDRAGACQQDEYLRSNVRNGVKSFYYLVPAEFLRPIREWT